MKAMYTAHATATGGRAGHVESDDGTLSLDLAMPKEMGGNGDGTNPEQLFAAGYAACFHSALQFVAGQGKTDVSGSQVKGHVSIGENDAGPGFKLAVVLEWKCRRYPKARRSSWRSGRIRFSPTRMRRGAISTWN